MVRGAERGAGRYARRPSFLASIVVPALEQSRLRWLANDEQGTRAEAAEVGEAIPEGRSRPSDGRRGETDLPHQLVLDAIAEHDPAKVVVALREGEDGTSLEER